MFEGTLKSNTPIHSGICFLHNIWGKYETNPAVSNMLKGLICTWIFSWSSLLCIHSYCQTQQQRRALGYEMGSGQIFKASCWVLNTFENLAPDSLVPFQKEISLCWPLANQLWKSFCTVISVKHKSRSPAFSAWLSTVTNHYAALRYAWNIPR